VELMLKFTADEQKNEPLFNLLQEFLEFLNNNREQGVLDLGLAKFKIAILQATGLGINYPKAISSQEKVFFSSDRGGFVNNRDSGGLQVSSGSVDQFLMLKEKGFKELAW